ncbi:hypothetical protein GCM10022244_48700 [Streptomyces gulbargensis]|uniref:Uncharacterized protein n=1 Tax=Streptomyces gulbargensis TaxID=364901 RepID=A0ABP7N1B3_9ACTN
MSQARRGVPRGTGAAIDDMAAGAPTVGTGWRLRRLARGALTVPGTARGGYIFPLLPSPAVQ